MDSLPPAEAPEFQTKPHRRFDREDRLTSAQSSTIEAILAYFPRDRLQSFRCVLDLRNASHASLWHVLVITSRTVMSELY